MSARPDPQAPRRRGRQIASGKRAPGSRLPSINALAAQYDIATATVVKALRILKAAGQVTGSPGHGTFVAER